MTAKHDPRDRPTVRSTFRFVAVGLALVIGAVLGGRFLVLDPVTAALGMGESQAALARHLGVLGAVVLGYWLFARVYERRSPLDLGVRPRTAAWSLATGPAMILCTILPLYAIGAYAVDGTRSWEGALHVVPAILTAAALEEFVFRGVLFRALERHMSARRAMVPLALGFGLLHLLNDGVTAWTVVSVTLLGLLWTAIYDVTRSLWASTLHHAAWNATIFATGLPLSGNEDWRALAPFQSQASGSALLTGGAFGPEDSLVNIALVPVFVWAVYRFTSQRARARAIGVQEETPVR